MSRFVVVLILAALLAAAALKAGSTPLFSAVALTLLILIGLGVAIPQLRFFGPYVCRGNSSRPWVALTFDDGPDPGSTPPLLELLRVEGVPTAFFCVGKRVAAERELVARIASEGHLLGNHSYTHSNTTNFFGLKRLREEMRLTQSAVQEATGVAPTFFRPPMGLSNPLVFQAARGLGLRVIGWSVRGLDTQIAAPERVVARITRRLKPGAIILLHDGGIPADRLLVTVKLLLAKLRESGYEPVRLDKLLA